MDSITCDYVINKFLKRHFPKRRIRVGVSFKPGYIIPSKFSGDGERHYVIKHQLEYIYEDLYIIIERIFGLNGNEIRFILGQYLR